jgi:predicted nucleotidyltransferase
VPSDDEQAMLRDLLRITKREHKPPLAVGANARFLVLDERYALPAHRLTQDWDFAARFQSWQGYREFAGVLTGDGVFKQTHPHRFVHTATNTPIDLVPYGELAAADDTIEWPETGRSMNVLGFHAAFQNAEEIEIAGEYVRVATPPWHVALKLFAYADRGQERDLTDIAFILDHATEAFSARVFEELSDELADEVLGYDSAGPYLLARDLLRQSPPKVIAALQDVLTRILDEPDHLALRRLLLRAGSLERREQLLEEFVRRLEAFRRGLRLDAP